MTMNAPTSHSYISYSTGARVDRVLVASTKHMPDLNEDLTPWQWGDVKVYGMTWFWAYEEDCNTDGKLMPGWLLNLCIAARQQHGCNWVLLDPEGDVVPGLPTYEHP